MFSWSIKKKVTWIATSFWSYVDYSTKPMELELVGLIELEKLIFTVIRQFDLAKEVKYLFCSL